MCRVIEDLRGADYAKGSPWAGKAKRPRGAKLAGLRYEKLVGKELARRELEFEHGPWIEFNDRNGRGFAQPDYIVKLNETRWVILEAKLSQTPKAFEQLFSLYTPLLEFIHPEVEFFPVQVCKILRARDGEIVDDLNRANAGSTWHWIT